MEFKMEEDIEMIQYLICSQTHAYREKLNDKSLIN